MGHRAIGARNLTHLALLAALMGRAIHSSMEKWTAQVERIQGLSPEHGSPPAT